MRAGKPTIVRLRFEHVIIHGERRFKDRQGRTHVERRKFWQTINPFNLDADGKVKTREVIVAELEREMKEWVDEVEGVAVKVRGGRSAAPISPTL